MMCRASAAEECIERRAGQRDGHADHESHFVRFLSSSCSLEAVFTCHANPKYFFFHSSHRIFERMHEALNVGKKNN
jgi:hypothetical protein